MSPNYSSNSTEIIYNNCFYGKMCSRFQLKMPATHFSGLSSRTGLDPLTARTPPPPACAHRHVLAWLSRWGSRGGEGMAPIPVGRWNEEEGQGAPVRNLSSRPVRVGKRALEEGELRGCGLGSDPEAPGSPGCGSRGQLGLLWQPQEPGS